MIQRLIVVVAVVAILFLTTLVVRATEFGSEEYFRQHVTTHAPRSERRHRPHRHVKRPEPRTVIVYRDRPVHVDPRCRPAFETVGDQAVSESLARDAAEKAWQQGMRFDLGELWADPAHAQDKKWQCVKSSVGAGIFYRCRLRAQPCRPDPQQQ